jgi:hypothetical protein
MTKLRAAYGGAYIAWVDVNAPQVINTVDLVELRHRKSSPQTRKYSTTVWNRLNLRNATMRLRKTSCRLSRLRPLWEPCFNSV